MPLENVLYRKYRSKTFKEVLSQDSVVEVLIKSILKDRVSHAYLFSGPRGTGKTTLARLLAKAINCQKFKETGDVCNVCDMCVSIDNFASTDIIELDAASNRGIEEIRTLKESVNYSPSILKKKVYIIDEAHMLTKEAFNALLKTLEEPPNHVVFILATTESHKLPITILSRVERYDLNLANEEKIIEKLKYIAKNEDIPIEDDVFKIIYKRSGGSFRDSESLLSKLINISDKENKESISRDDVYKVLGIINDDLIDEFLNYLKIRDLDGSLSTYESFKLKGYTPVLILDNLLDRSRDLIISNLKLANQLVPVITFLINTKVLIKDFLDKDLLITLEITKFCKDSSSGTDKPEKPKDKKILTPPTDLKESTPIEFKDTKALVKETETSGLLNNVIDIVASDFPRARIILKSSEITLDNLNLKISIPYQMDYIYLNKEVFKSLIIKNLRINNTNIESVSILYSQNIQASNDEDSLEKVDNTNNIEDSSENIDKKKVEAIIDVKIESIDNTSLVEDLFNLV